MRDAQAILHALVNDLEKTATGLAVLSAQMQTLMPKTRAELEDEATLASQAHQNFYNGLRKRIDALQLGA